MFFLCILDDSTQTTRISNVCVYDLGFDTSSEGVVTNL
jgi:hypothetical protein